MTQMYILYILVCLCNFALCIVFSIKVFLYSVDAEKNVAFCAVIYMQCCMKKGIYRVTLVLKTHSHIYIYIIIRSGITPQHIKHICIYMAFLDVAFRPSRPRLRPLDYHMS